MYFWKTIVERKVNQTTLVNNIFVSKVKKKIVIVKTTVITITSVSIKNVVE